MNERKYRSYPEAFKLEALALLQKGEKSAGQIERELGITPGMLVKWRARYQAVEKGLQEVYLEPSDLEAAKAEIKRLQRELAEVAERKREHPKKSSQYFLTEKPMIYKFMVAHEDEFGIVRMSRVLGVSRSGYYAWRSRPTCMRRQADQVLVVQIDQEYRKSRETYGVSRIHAALQRKGVVCGRNRIARLMRLHQLVARKAHKHFPHTTQRNSQALPAPNLLNQDFSSPAADQKWVSDITYIDTAEGWLYLAAVVDLFSRQVVGWAMADHMETSLVEEALKMAMLRRQPAPGLLHHSDQGSQYTSEAYQQALANYHCRVSMSRVGNCFDNATMESFFSTLKAECARQPFTTRSQARTTIFEFIEGWYNRQRLHSALGYLSPVEFELNSRH